MESWILGGIFVIAVLAAIAIAVTIARTLHD